MFSSGCQLAWKILTVKIESLKRHFVVRVQLQPVSARPPRPGDRFGLKNVTKLLRVLGRFVADLGAGVEVVDTEEVVVGARHDSLGRAAPAALELVEDAVVLVERAEARAEVVVHGEGADGVRLHVHVPHLHVQVVPRQDVAPRRVEVLSEMETITSEKKDLLVGSSASWNHFACWSHRARARMSQTRMAPVELE